MGTRGKVGVPRPGADGIFCRVVMGAKASLFSGMWDADCRGSPGGVWGLGGQGCGAAGWRLAGTAMEGELDPQGRQVQQGQRGGDGMAQMREEAVPARSGQEGPGDGGRCQFSGPQRRRSSVWGGHCDWGASVSSRAVSREERAHGQTAKHEVHVDLGRKSCHRGGGCSGPRRMGPWRTRERGAREQGACQ